MDVVGVTLESMHVILGTAGGLGSPATLPGSHYRAGVGDINNDSHLDAVGNNPTSV